MVMNLDKVMEGAVSEYLKKTPKSREIYEKAREIFPGGIQHNIRFFKPYPFFVNRAEDQHLYDVDGNEYTDYWMGHMALILGHTPKPVVEALEKQVAKGTQWGTTNTLAVELGKKVCEAVPCAEMVRFCVTGTESTMYAVRLARSYTGRRLVLKMEGGWHGGNPILQRAVSAPFEIPESRGILEEETKNVGFIPFNDPDTARGRIRDNAEDLACVIVEPLMSGGGALPAEADFLETLREETERYGALLIFDEVITGFRLALGGGQEHYGIKPDLCTFGKILGGGLPMGAVCGRRDVMELADPTRFRKKERTWIGGGTFSGNPMSMASGLAMITTLAENREKIYGKINRLGEEAREKTDAIFDDYDIPSLTAGLGSLLMTHFLKDRDVTIKGAGDRARYTDRQIQFAYYFSLIVSHGVYFLPEHTGSISYAHTREDVDRLLEGTEGFARKLGKAG
ncbi:MAG: aspartate aminotransferase family protein [Candidatus Bathyarchaeia archaeon]